MTDTDLDYSFDGRRYSSVAVRHPSLTDMKSLSATIAGLATTHPISSDRQSGVSTFRAEWRHKENMYPYGSLLRKAAEEDNSRTYTHHCFVAMLRNPSDQSPTFVFASPHIRVVGFWSTHLSSSVDSPRPLYVAPRLDPLFHDLAASSTLYRATQITLQLPNNVAIDKVALTGKSPLISSLRDMLGPVTEPYAVRLEVPREGRPLRFHMDRHGNYWWHQANEEAFPIAVEALAALGSNGYLGSTHDMPHLRVIPPAPTKAKKPGSARG